MKHDHVKARDGFDILDAAEIWPRADALGAPALAEVEQAFVRAAPAAPDVPPAVGRVIVGVYAALVGILFLTMARGAEATFMIAVSGLYVAIFLAVPRLFFAVEADPSRRPDLAAFLARGIDTWTGHLSGGAALVQILLVPVLLTACLLAIGLAALWIL